MMKNYSRRTILKGALKSAGGATAIGALAMSPISLAQQKEIEQVLQEKVKQDPWRTLNSTLNHLLPASKTGPSAKEINALNYLYQIITVQPTPEDEKAFIFKGVGWLNGFSKSEQKKEFPDLDFDQKEQVLRKISRSKAGENWINTLLNYLLEAMLSPDAYGGNPNGIGWQWLDHQGGFPLPKKGQRYFELPRRSQAMPKDTVESEETQQSAEVIAHFSSENLVGINSKIRLKKGMRKA
ncbi:MAG: gluconate 2-dehydrogenase subunit 3 family protein [Colwellia sp.]